jgi:hypothetical protein
MTTAVPSTALATIQPAFTDAKRLSCAFLSARAAIQPGSDRTHDDQLIPLIRHEIRRLFTGLSHQPPAPPLQLHWWRWRRRHQAIVRACPYRRRAPARHDYEVPPEY